jgi:hypothetical protein
MNKQLHFKNAGISLLYRQFLYLFFLFFMGMQFATSQTTRFWVGPASGDFNNGSNWSNSSGGTAVGGAITFPNNDIFVVDGNSLASVTITSLSNNANNQIGKLKITGNRTVILNPSSLANRTLTIRENATDALVVDSGSTLIVNGLDAATDRTMTLTMNATAGSAVAAISGTVKVTKDALSTVNGSFTKGANGLINFLPNSVYEHNINGGAIPVSTWDATSLCKITGVTATLPNNASLNQIFGNREWNNSNQSVNFNITPQLFFQPDVLNTIALNNTGTGQLSYIGNATYYGNTIVSGGKYIFNAANATRSIIIGALTISGGTLSVSESASATAARIHSLTVSGDLTINGGTLEVNNSPLATGRLFVDKSFNLITGALNYTQALTTGISGVYFTGVGGTQNFVWSGGTLNTATTGVGRRFYFKTASPLIALNETYNASIPQATINGTEGTPLAGYAAWPTSGTKINNVTVSNSAGVTLTTNKVTNGNLTVFSGFFDLGVFTINHNTPVGGAINVANGAGLIIGGTNTYPANYGTNSLGALSTVTYNGTSQTIANTPNYSNLVLSGTGAKTFTGDLNIVNDLTLNSGATFSIPSGQNITVGNIVNNNGATTDFVVNSNANLIQIGTSTNVGAITVKRDSNALFRLDYTLWSSPVFGTQTLGDFSPLTNSTRFYTYNPGTNAYASVPPTTPFTTGTGYLIRMPNTDPLPGYDAGTAPLVYPGVFTGTPNNGNVVISVGVGTYNAIGNPYPSTIDADLFMSGNGITEALYFWRKTNGATGSAYATYTLAGGVGTGPSGSNALVPNGIIQVGQGFIAKATAGSLYFSNLIRVNDNANQFFKTTTIERHRVWLNLSEPNGGVNQMMVAYMTNATSGIDDAIDGKYINDSQTALTSIINTQEYTIQGRALPFNASDVVSLGFKTTTEGTFTIAIDHVDGLFANGQAVYLKDNLTNTTHNLSEGSYTFTSIAGVFNTRFEIVYQMTLSTNNPVFNENNVVVYQKDKALFIDSANVLLNNVKVYDITGRLLIEEKTINASQIKLYPNTANEVLIVKITTEDNHIITKKVVQ